MQTEITPVKKPNFKRVLLWVLILMVGFAAGVSLTAHITTKSTRFVDDTVRTFMANQYAMIQYQQAEYPEAKAALQAYLRYLDSVVPSGEKTKSGQNPWFNERRIAMDKALTWGRLALLDERNGNSEGAKTSWQHARTCAIKAKWKNTSLENIRTVIERSDAKAIKYGPEAKP